MLGTGSFSVRRILIIPFSPWHAASKGRVGEGRVLHGRVRRLVLLVVSVVSIAAIASVVHVTTTGAAPEPSRQHITITKLCPPQDFNPEFIVENMTNDPDTTDPQATPETITYIITKGKEGSAPTLYTGTIAPGAQQHVTLTGQPWHGTYFAQFDAMYKGRLTHFDSKQFCACENTKRRRRTTRRHRVSSTSSRSTSTSTSTSTSPRPRRARRPDETSTSTSTTSTSTTTTSVPEDTTTTYEIEQLHDHEHRQQTTRRAARRPPRFASVRVRRRPSAAKRCRRPTRQRPAGPAGFDGSGYDGSGYDGPRRRDAERREPERQP